MLWQLIENLSRLVMEWAIRRQEYYTQPRFFPSVIQEVWDRPILRKDGKRV